MVRNQVSQVYFYKFKNFLLKIPDEFHRMVDSICLGLESLQVQGPEFFAI